ncbi:MAG TPA: M55 family metallopeptidase [Candidatus Bipolaricaulis sp.]|nr:M55 family metallopeptidase [Candidatus Bipolaricaulis sp.]MDY0392280.1 M55 family metallopeptidase [Candidatus Bipolaricaulis sp.]HPD07035.1 M55 family metallopeptidase [Candidatus Bipolaricaulis sp.]HRS13923.1 M55 family metallopeptidase [Candidatus Bipolaricaulis sp.]HRU21369.1 M55 family metallopeptidase [Candidatus Bipolaricaulis sp.]
MKVYVSADIEGIAGVTHWDETEIGKVGYEAARRQLAAEVWAACEGAAEAGAREILVKDAHDTGRNLTPADLPPGTELHRGWGSHPLAMVEGLDPSFAGLILVGYHAPAGSAGSPLAHTLSPQLHALTINDHPAAELLLVAYSAAYVGVPLLFVSGDAETCAEAQRLNPHIVTTAVKRGVGGATVSLDAGRAVEGIRTGVAAALTGDPTRCRIPLPKKFSVEMTYRDHPRAYRASFYPGASLTEPRSVRFAASDFLDVLRFLLFAA